MKKKGYPFFIILLAIAIVVALSLVPWGRMTNGIVKDYDLLSDLRTDSTLMVGGGDEFIDPDLIKEMAEMDSVVENADTISIAPVRTFARNAQPRVDGEMVIEDFTPGGVGLKNLKEALEYRYARIAVMGDSYIEGDILTQDIRSQMQDLYGGAGVGYVPAHSQVSGFRRTVNMSSSGWNQVGIQNASKSNYFTIMGEYFVGEDGATVTYKGTKDDKLSSWNQSRVLFIAPRDGSITLYNDVDTIKFDISGCPEVQAITLNGETSMFKIQNNVPGLIFLGAYLDEAVGVKVDCMSVRGDSGITHRRLNTDLAAGMSQYVDYDLIILEYGINALTAKQDDYTRYGSIMREVAERIKECYPHADVLIMGIGDRGQKIGGEVHSLPTAQAMVDAQRKAAQDAGVLFWDTREAMGGEDAIVDWRQRKLVNSDYIHLNSQGGKVLATELVNSLQRMLNE